MSPVVVVTVDGVVALLQTSNWHNAMGVGYWGRVGWLLWWYTINAASIGRSDDGSIFFTHSSSPLTQSGTSLQQQ